jgi:hypothetical protein
MVMGRKLTITIVVDPDAREIVVSDDAGNRRAIKSIMIFGGDAESGALYLLGWGASADAAWAFKEGYLRALESGDAHYRSFYKQCACHIVQCIDPGELKSKVDAAKTLERWSLEDLGRETIH